MKALCCHVLAIWTTLWLTEGFAPRETQFQASWTARSSSLPYSYLTLSGRATSISSVDDIFTKELAGDLASEVQARVDVPFVPAPVVEYVLTEAIVNLSSGLSPKLLERVTAVLAAGATESSLDDFSTEELALLSSDVAKEMNPLVDVPLLDEAQEEQVLAEIFKVVFGVLAASDATRRKQLVNNIVQVAPMGRDLLAGDDESRRKLARQINERVDLPLLDERAEEELLVNAVQSCAATLETLLPPELIQTLRGEKPEQVIAMKKFVIDQVNDKVDLIGFDEKQEKALIETMVDVLIDQYIDGTEMEFLWLSPEEQQEKLKDNISLLERELESSRERFAREQANLKAQLDRLRARARGKSKTSLHTKPSRLPWRRRQ